MKRESIYFDIEGKRVYGDIHLPKKRNPPCIVTLHGLESSKDSGKWPVLAYRFCEAGFSCLRFSFKGCGEGNEKSEGFFEDTSLTNRIKDYEAALIFLEETGIVNMGMLGAIGSSFGGMVAIAAQNRKIKALVTLATPYTLSEPIKPSLGGRYYMLPSGRRLKEKFLQDLQKYDLLRAIEDAPPILIIHGSKDGFIPVEHAYRLYEAAKKPKGLEIIDGANHTFSRPNDLDGIIDLSLGWFKKYLGIECLES